jgi:hypothetical protein
MVYTWHLGLNGNDNTWVQKSWKMTLEGKVGRTRTIKTGFMQKGCGTCSELGQSCVK